uniref:NADH dehydrogenase [ubiquinone] 1 beta subcomplex subunit 11, mitochondrial n=1 Tax=Scolopendra viridis TaxID=118503 RepID=A0A4D5R901_SCOVI
MASAYCKFLQTSCRFILKNHHVLPKPFTIPVSCISTSKKSKDTVAVESILKPVKTETKSTENVDRVKEWISYGFDPYSESRDRWAFHSMFFFSVTVCIVGGTFVLMYQPDNRMRDWVLREAYLELNRRERDGLPLIDRELIPREKITLPGEEELQGVEIII